MRQVCGAGRSTKKEDVVYVKNPKQPFSAFWSVYVSTTLQAAYDAEISPLRKKKLRLLLVQTLSICDGVQKTKRTTNRHELTRIEII